MEQILQGIGWLAAISIAFFCWKNKHSLTSWIFVGMLVGILIGITFPNIGVNLDVISSVFLRLIKTVVAPLIFGTLVLGIAGHSDLKQVGRMGWKSLVYFEIATTIALFVGLVAINYTKAGVGVRPEKAPIAAVFMPADSINWKVQAIEKEGKRTFEAMPMLDGKTLATPKPLAKQDWKDIVLHTFPENVSKMVYEGAVLQVVIFSLLFGMGLTKVADPHKKTMLHWIEAFTETMFKFTNLIMYLAPFAVMGAIAFTISKMGIGVVKNLLMLLGTLYGALIVFILLVFVPVMLICKIPMLKFLRAVKEPATLAFATASSEAALPKALIAMENFGVPRKIVSFTLPLGYSFNLDGSTLYLAIASIFVAQAAGIDLPIGTQLLMMASLMLTSKGVAGVARASLVILAGTVAQFNLPDWPIFSLILGVDALMDMARTGVNLVGNCLATCVVARWEGEFDDEKANAD
jgi:proton glutamate symport protein